MNGLIDISRRRDSDDNEFMENTGTTIGAFIYSKGLVQLISYSYCYICEERMPEGHTCQ